jgi:hypothetical protein
MNDSEEVQRFMGFAADAVRSLQKEPRYANLREMFEYSLANLDVWNEYSFFVVSFSTEPDALSQWRGYGGPEQAIALGFSREALGRIGARWRFEQCIYDPDHARSQARALVGAGMKSVLAGDWDEVVEHARLDQAARVKIQEYAPLFKHEAFAEEKEWRLIGLPTTADDVRYRPSKYGITPYLEVDLPRFDTGHIALHEAVIGPGATREGVHGFKNLVWNGADYRSQVRVYTSSAPFR